MMEHVLEWKDGPMISELRWGIRKGPKSPINNSTRLAIITRDSNTVTDKGSQTKYEVSMTALFKCNPPSGQMSFDTLDEAKRKAEVLAGAAFYEQYMNAERLREASEARIKEGAIA